MERYRVGDLILDVDAATLGSGECGRRRILLAPLTFKLLVALVRRAPEVVRRADLLQTVWHGENVTDAALSQRVNLLRNALGDSPDAPRIIGSVRGWGYRVLAPVEKLREPDEPIVAIAVLPFENLSHDPGQNGFADALTDALITSLSRTATVRVVSRTTSLHYAYVDKPLPVIARELGVQAIIEGAVLQAGDRTWATAQLVRAATDQHLWARSYDCRGEFVDVLDELASNVASDINRAIKTEDRRRARATLLSG